MNLINKEFTKERGFTLIELLVVIAIIAILVVIVIVAINPIQRLKDASDRRSDSDVRSAGTLISNCVTHQQSLIPPGGIEVCSVVGTLGTYGTIPNSVYIDPSATVGDNDVCASAQGSIDHYYVYRMLTPGTYGVTTVPAGIVTEVSGTILGTPAGRCP